MSYPAEGTAAPDFTLDTDAGTPLTLSALRGRPVVLFFYPKDDTPGCTIESCEFRDLMPRFQGVKAEVLGVSPDDVKSHVKFRKKFALPYSLFAHKYWGNARTTFVIDRDGRIAKVFEKVKPEGHAAEVAEAVAGL